MVTGLLQWMTHSQFITLQFTKRSLKSLLIYDEFTATLQATFCPTASVLSVKCLLILDKVPWFYLKSVWFITWAPFSSFGKVPRPCIYKPVLLARSFVSEMSCRVVNFWSVLLFVAASLFCSVASAPTNNSVATVSALFQTPNVVSGVIIGGQEFYRVDLKVITISTITACS